MSATRTRCLSRFLIERWQMHGYAASSVFRLAVLAIDRFRLQSANPASLFRSAISLVPKSGFEEPRINPIASRCPIILRTFSLCEVCVAHRRSIIPFAFHSLAFQSDVSTSSLI
ncbi:hypothetical protein PENTCL1PPCAC_857, partial [Pristionchus entomophagus]